MSLVIPIGGWLNLSGGGGVVKKRESADFRSLEVGISVIMSKSRGVLLYKSDRGARRTFWGFKFVDWYRSGC